MNPYAGNIGTGARAGYYNSAAGNSGFEACAANYNATGNYRTAGPISGYIPALGSHNRGAGGTVSNAYTGSHAAGARGLTYKPQTAVARAAGMAGNAYTVKSAGGSRGFSYHTKIGNGAAHARNNVYADRGRNFYNSGWQQHTSDAWPSLASDWNNLPGTWVTSAGVTSTPDGVAALEQVAGPTEDLGVARALAAEVSVEAAFAAVVVFAASQGFHWGSYGQPG